MSSVFRKWYERRFHDEEAILLLIIISIGVALVLFVGEFFTARYCCIGVGFFAARYGESASREKDTTYFLFVNRLCIAVSS